MALHARRLDDHIRELCAKVTAAENSDELHVILPEMRSSIHQAIERLRTRAAAILYGHRDPPNERRKT